MTEGLYLSRAKLSTRLAFVAAGFGVACWAPLVPFAKTRCHLGADTMGLVLLLLGDGSIVAMPLAANLSARFSSKPVVLSGGVGLALILPLLSIVSSPIEAACRERQEKGSQGGTVRTHLREPKISDRGNILMFDKGVGLDLRNEPQRRAPSQLIEAERMLAIGRMTCSISHDMRHSLTAIYANAEFLERDDICACVRADLLLEIQEAVLAMTERIDSLLEFGSNGRKSPLVRARVSLVVEKAVAAVKFHPDGRNVSITVGKFPPTEADIDARNLESAIYNLLLNACQAAARSTHVPEVKVHLTEVDERIYVTILDNGPGIPASVRRTLFDPFVTAGKPNGTGLGLTLARRVAEEHGGSVCLEKSNRERTVFTLSLTKNRSLPLEGPKTDTR